MSTPFRALRAFLIVLWSSLGAVLVLGIVLSNLPIDGTLQVDAFPGEPSPFVGQLRPVQRVSLVDSGAGLQYVAEDEPLYFQLAALPYFHRATVRVEYVGGPERPALGGRVHPTEWRFDLRSLEPAETLSDGWLVGEASFDLGGLHKDERGEAQMIVSLPPAGEEAEPFRVRRVGVVYERPPLTVERVVEALLKRLPL